MAMGWRDQYQRYREFFLNIEVLYKKRADLRAFVELILSISTVVIFLNFALKPTALTIISLYNDIQEKKATIAALDQKIANLGTASDLLNQYQNAIPDIDISVGDTPRPDTISQQLEGLAAKDSVTLMGISIGELTLVGTAPALKTGTELTPMPDNAKSMDLSMSVKGDYPSLIAFIKDFENLRTIVKMDVMGINASTVGTESTIINVVTGRAPYTGKQVQTQ